HATLCQASGGNFSIISCASRLQEPSIYVVLGPIVERLVVETPKTKRLVAVLKALGLDSAVVVDGKHNGNLAKSVRNLTVCTCLPPEGLNVYDILMRSGLVIAKDVVKEVEARIVGSGAEAAA
ncbi:MAG: 50S ribosomal protein L4, partial [Polyangia bacterium]